MTADQSAAREYILSASLRLEVGAEAAFDRGLVLLAFPASPGGRSSEGQLLDELTLSNSGVYGCRRDVATGAFIISRQESAT